MPHDRSPTRPAPPITFRRATAADVRPAYAVFRHSLAELLRSSRLSDGTGADGPAIEAAWARQRAWIGHLHASAAEDWVAVDREGRVVGWALSVERDGLLELTHCFVQPGIQGRGVGRGLLERALPPPGGRPRVLVATPDARALGLYLRAGLGFVGTSADLVVRARPSPPTTDLVFEPLTAEDGSLELVAAIERRVIGHRRDADARFLLGLGPAWVARRRDAPVGFVFGARPSSTGTLAGAPADSGPMAALDPADLPALIDHVLDDAAGRGIGEVDLGVPLVARTAVAHLLALGARIDPFYLHVLADAPSLGLDRWIHTSPMFIL